MITLNSNSMILPSALKAPSFGFDADNYKLNLRNTDFRDTPVLSYTINETTYETTGLSEYDLPDINTEYDITITAVPTDTSLKTVSFTSKIFKNASTCKNFVYSGDYHSTDIKGYRGTGNDVIIPDMHNLVYMTSATITSFPNVSSSFIKITTPVRMTSFNIRDKRITEFTIKGNLEPIAGQFKDMPNLENINGTFTKCSAYMFANCPKLNMNPSNTKGLTSVPEHAFYNTPKQKVIRVSADTLQQSSFDGGDEKVIFTSAQTVNGFNQKTLTSNTALPYTGGKHQVYCGLNDLDWTGVSASDDTVKVLGYNNGSSTIITDGMKIYQGCIGFKAKKDVLGFFIKITSVGGATKMSGMYYLPKEYSDGDVSFVVNDSFYTDGDYKYFIVTASQFYGSAAITSTDRLIIQPIDMNGLSSKVYKYTLLGADLSVEPTAPILKVLYTAGIKQGTIDIDNGAYRNELISSAPIYSLYMVLDEKYPNIMFRFLNKAGDAYYNFGTDTSPDFTRYHDFTNDRYLLVSGKKVYILHIDDYIPASKISSYPTFRVYYNGYTTPVYNLPLTKQLSGFTSSN